MTGITIELDVPVPMRDGVVLRADVYRPAGAGPFPVIVARTPYDKSEAAELLYLEPVRAARRGLIAVVQDVRGRFASEGDFQALVNEAEDGADTIAWAASLPGSTGVVGMWGLSYLGNVQWQAAGQQPPALKAIAPSFTFREGTNGLAQRGGARELGLVRSWAVGMGFDLLSRRHADDEVEHMKQLELLIDAADGTPGPTYLELPTAVDPVITRQDLPDLAAPVTSGASDVRQHQTRVSVPSLHVAGWYDVFLQPTLDNYAAAAEQSPAQLVVGPWNHVSQVAMQGDVNFGVLGNAVDGATPLLEHTFDWLHSQLADDATPAGDDLPVKLFVMGENQWRSEPAWPLARAVPTAYHLGNDAVLTTEPGAAGTRSFTYDPADPVPTMGGPIMLPHTAAGAFEQSRVEAREDVLLFTGSELTEDLEVTGRVTASLTAETDGPTTDWVVRLCDVHPDGRSYVVVDGISRVEGTPGEASVVEVDLWSTSMVFKKGHRLRVQVTSSCFPRWDRNLNTVDGARTGEMRSARQTVRVGTGGSTVTLPVVPRAVAE
jgi:putative CocE/NonD family hydrolase